MLPPTRRIAHFVFDIIVKLASRRGLALHEVPCKLFVILWEDEVLESFIIPLDILQIVNIESSWI